MKSKILKLGVQVVLACTYCGGFAQQINPITEAVLQNYGEILAENPKDYVTLYDRASQYYDMGEYVRALSDIDMALEYIPDNDNAYRQAAYSLKSDILTSQKNYNAALEAVNAALKVNPVSQPDLYKAGNIYLLTNNPGEALKAFQRLQRENPRSQEAFYGIAKAYVMSGNRAEAEKLIKEVESLGMQSFITYCRIGDLYADMGNLKDAAANYTIAYTMEDNSIRPVESLKVINKKDPKTVMGAIDDMIVSKPDNLALLYIKAILAFDWGNYSEAEKACKDLAKGLEEDSPAVYRMMGMSQLAQNKLDEAAQSIETAEKLAPSDAGVILDKAEITIIKDPKSAYDLAVKALTLNPDNERGEMVAATAAMKAGKYLEAQTILNNMILSNPSNIEALLLRGYLNSEYLKDGKSGLADYTRAGNAQQNGSVENLVYAALGKAKTNKKLDADGMINEAIGKATDKDAFYLIAIYFAQTGNLEKAKEYMDKAVASGYGNLYNLQRNDTPLLNLQPIQHLTGGK